MSKGIWGGVVLAVVLAGTALSVQAGMPGAGETNSAVFMDIDGLKREAAHGNWAAQYELGMRYHQGRDVPKDEMQALLWFRKAAEQGHDMALLMMGQAYEFGTGVDKDFAQAAIWYRKAADNGQPSAQAALGNLYWLGKGVTKDHDAAINWDRKAADQNLFYAMSNLAQIYRADGDVANMVKWHDKACNKGHAMSCFILGNEYSEATLLTKDAAQAFAYYKKGALLGLPEAQYQVGRSYYDGAGVKNDDVEAYTWISIAADNGLQDAADDFKTIDPQFTLAQKADMVVRKVAWLKAINKRMADVGVVMLYNLHNQPR